MNITKFLKARIAEDEALAQAAVTVGVTRVKYLRDGKWGAEYVEQLEVGGSVTRGVVWRIAPGPSSPGSTGSDEPASALFAQYDPARVLAECAAKRRIVELHAPEAFADDPDLTFCRHDQRTAGVWPCDTIRILASVYADHRDYDPAWRDADD